MYVAKSMKFQHSFLRDEGLSFVQSPAPEEAKIPADKKAPLLQTVFWAIEISFHPEVLCWPV